MPFWISISFVNYDNIFCFVSCDISAGLPFQGATNVPQLFRIEFSRLNYKKINDWININEDMAQKQWDTGNNEHLNRYQGYSTISESPCLHLCALACVWARLCACSLHVCVSELVDRFTYNGRHHVPAFA